MAHTYYVRFSKRLLEGPRTTAPLSSALAPTLPYTARPRCPRFCIAARVEELRVKLANADDGGAVGLDATLVVTRHVHHIHLHAMATQAKAWPRSHSMLTLCKAAVKAKPERGGGVGSHC